MLAKIDQDILNYWFTYPSERAWAYGMTLLPVLVVVAMIINAL